MREVIDKPTLLDKILTDTLFKRLKKKAKAMSHEEFSEYLKSINCPFYPRPKSMELAVALYKADYYAQFIKKLPDYHQAKWKRFVDAEKTRLTRFVVGHYLTSRNV